MGTLDFSTWGMAEAAVADPDPARGLERFRDFGDAFNAEKRRYAAALIDRVASDEVSARTAERIQQLTQAAVDANALAPDVTARDIKALIIALRGVVAASPDEDNIAWRRFLRLHLTGLRATT